MANVKLGYNSVAFAEGNRMCIRQLGMEYLFSLDDLDFLYNCETLWTENIKVPPNYIGTRLSASILEDDNITYIDSDLDGRYIVVANKFTDSHTCLLLVYSLKIGDKIKSPLQISRKDFETLMNR